MTASRLILGRLIKKAGIVKSKTVLIFVSSGIIFGLGVVLHLFGAGSQKAAANEDESGDHRKPIPPPKELAKLPPRRRT